MDKQTGWGTEPSRKEGRGGIQQEGSLPLGGALLGMAPDPSCCSWMRELTWAPTDNLLVMLGMRRWVASEWSQPWGGLPNTYHMHKGQILSIL